MKLSAKHALWRAARALDRWSKKLDSEGDRLDVKQRLKKTGVLDYRCNMCGRWNTECNH